MPLIGGYNDLWGISMKRKLLVILTVVLLLCGCGTNVRPPQEEEQCTINEDLRIRTLAEVWYLSLIHIFLRNSCRPI